MAKNKNLSNCRTCDKEISKNAKTCPHCGEKKPVNKSSGIKMTIFIIVIVGLWASAHFADPPPPKAPLTAEQKTLKNEESNRFAATTVFGKALKYNIKDPSSVEWTQIMANKKGTLVCFKYRAKNSFGALVIERTAIRLGQQVDWNKNCAGKSLFDVTRAGKHI